MDDYSNYYPTVIDTTLTDGKEIFELQLVGLEGKEVLFNSDSISRNVLIQRHTNPLNLTKKDYKISTRYSETLNRGDNIKYNSNSYLVVSIPEDNEMYRWADMEHATSLCNFIGVSGSIHSYPCIYKLSSATNVDVSANKYIEMLEGDAVVRVQSNEFTQQLTKRNGQRLIFSSEECFIINNVYTQLESGIVILKLKQSEFNFATDRLIDDGSGNMIWVAHYEDASELSVKIDQSNSEIVMGDLVQLSAQATKDGESHEYALIWNSSDDNIVTVDSNGNITTVADGNATITVNIENNSDVNDSINIVVTNSAVDSFSYNITPEVEGILLGDKIVFNLEKYNNSATVVETFTFGINQGLTTSDDTDYIFEVIDSTRFSIENNNDGGVVVVNIVPDSMIADEFTKEIEMKYFS